jgi:hypothetical protein
MAFLQGKLDRLIVSLAVAADRSVFVSTSLTIARVATKHLILVGLCEGRCLFTVVTLIVGK